jgi:antitoxin (DNA-binding transcriptional repressor) of toxin-antitoxin stability system
LKLLRRVESGEEIIISRDCKPVAGLVPPSPLKRRFLGQDQGLYTVPPDFNATP